MKKPSFIIGKKQIILSCLTLMLAIAVYVNYAMSDGKLETAQVQSKDSVTYGDTAFVNAEANQAAEESQPTEESEPADETSGAYSVNGDAEETAADVEAGFPAPISASVPAALSCVSQMPCASSPFPKFAYDISIQHRTSFVLCCPVYDSCGTTSVITSPSASRSRSRSPGCTCAALRTSSSP